MMGASDRVEATRRALGTIGAFLPHSLAVPTPVEAQRAAVQRLERAGYRSAWTNEVPGKDALVQLAVLLAATEHLVFAPVSRTSGFGHHRRRTARPRSSQRPIPVASCSGSASDTPTRRPVSVPSSTGRWQ